MKVVGAVVAALCVVVGWWVDPLLVVGASCAFAGGAFLLHRRADPFVVLASVFFLLVLLPELAAIPPVVSVGGISVYVPHVLAAPLFAVANWRLVKPWLLRVLGLYCLLVLWMAGLGLLLGGPLVAVLQDARGPLTFVGGAAAALVLYERRGVSGLLRIVPVILVVSVAMIGAQLVTGLSLLGGRVGGAVGFGGVGQAGTAINATRFIVNSEDLAVAAILVVFWWSTQRNMKRLPPSTAAAIAGLSFMIVTLSLSRQLLVGLAVGAFGWLGVRGGIARLLRMAAASLPLVLVSMLCISLLTVAGQGIGSDNLIGRQVDGFSERVLGGLTSDGVAQDAGSSWRQRENERALALVAEEPFGTGLGRPYREEFEIESFGDPTFFRRWVHNVYLWYGTKGGWLGFLAVGLVSFVPLLVAVRRAKTSAEGADPIAEVAVPVLLAFAVMSLVDPVIVNSNSGVLTATLFALLGLREPIQPKKHRSARADYEQHDNALLVGR